MAKCKRYINYHVSRNSPYYPNYFMNILETWVTENLRSDLYAGPIYIMYATKEKYVIKFLRMDIDLFVPKTKVRLYR